MRRATLALGIVLVFLAGVVDVLVGRSSSSAVTPTAVVSVAPSPYGLVGDVDEPATPVPDLVLPATTGGTYDVEAANPGKTVLVYFGYTHCPDLCPLLMADTARALQEVAPSVRSKVAVVFVSVDPNRDSIPVLRHWLSAIDPSFVGMRGSIAQVIAAQTGFGLPPSEIDEQKAGSGYTVNHSAAIVAVTPDHLEHAFYVDGPTTISDLAHDLPILTSRFAPDAALATTGGTARTGLMSASGAFVPQPASTDVAAAYFTLRNDGSSPVTVTSVTVPGYGSTQFMTEGSGGMAMAGGMTAAGPAVVPAHGSLVLQQGHEHLMLMDPIGQVKRGDTLLALISLSDGTVLRVPLPVVSATGL